MPEIDFGEIAKQYGWIFAIALSIVLQVMSQYFSKKEVEVQAQKILQERFPQLLDENGHLKLQITKKDKKVMELTLRLDRTEDENGILKAELDDTRGEVAKLKSVLKEVEDSGIFRFNSDGTVVRVKSSTSPQEM